MAYDLGVSEKLGNAGYALKKTGSIFGKAAGSALTKASNKLTKIKPYQVLGVSTAKASSGPVVTGNYSPVKNFSSVNDRPAPVAPVAKVKTNISTGSDGNRGSSVSSFDTDGTESQSDLEFLRKKQMKAIGKNYDIEVGSLKDMERRARDAYGQSAAQVQAYYPEFQRLVGEQQTSTEGQITGLENTRKYESERALGQARQLLNDLQRRQYAQMSATGNYGSSVPEAFADQFGNKAYAAQSEIQQSRDKSLNELASKRVEAKQYFDQKLFEGKQKYDTMMQNLQQQLNAQLDQISNAKGKAAQAKNAESLDAWNNYVNNKFSLDQELRNYNQSLMQYAQQTENDGQNPFEQVNASGISNANSGQILTDTNNQVLGDASGYTNSNVPIIKRRLTPEEEQQYGMSGFGFQVGAGGF